MKKVLVLFTSPTIGSQKGSISKSIWHIFKKEYSALHNDEIIEMDLNNEPMASKTMTSNNFANYFNEKDSLQYIKQLRTIDKLVIVSSMTNFNYPAVLKNYLDHILVAGKTFQYKYDGSNKSVGLLSHLKVLIISTQGAEKGWYSWGDVPTMLEGTWQFMGASIVKSLSIYGTKTSEKINLSIEQVIEPHLKSIKKAATLF